MLELSTRNNYRESFRFQLSPNTVSNILIKTSIDVQSNYSIQVKFII